MAIKVSDDKYKTIIKVAGGEEKFVCPQALILNAYQGCDFNCVYCYADWIRDIYKHRDKVGSYYVFKRQLIKALKGETNDEVSQLLRQKVPIRMSNLSDPFQYREEDNKISYRILKTLKKVSYPVILNTKGVLWAKDKYLDLLKDMDVVVQETIITDDDELAGKLEPNAPSPSERIKAINKASELGINTQVRYSPVFPLLNDVPESLFDKLEVNDIITEFMRFSLNKSHIKALNDALGYDYFEMLKEEGYPIVKGSKWLKVSQDFIFEEYRRFKRLAEERGLNLFVCSEEKPEINGFENCCGTCKYNGFESCMDWTVQMRGEVFEDGEKSFNEYITGSCPYKKEFKEYWDDGKLEGSLTGLKKKGDSYVRRKNENS